MAMATKGQRGGDRAAAKATEGKDVAGGNKVEEMMKAEAGYVLKSDEAGGKKAGALHGMSPVEAKDSQTIVALQSPVTVMRPVRGDLEDHVPKPCTFLLSSSCCWLFICNSVFRTTAVSLCCWTN